MVYFIQGQQTQLIKIGKADTVESRLRYLQTGSPDQLTVRAVIENESDDRLYHRKFAPDWVWGEWFKPSDRLMDFIAQIPTSNHRGLTVTLANRSVSGAPRAASRAKAREERNARRKTGQLRRDRPGRPAKSVDLKVVCARLERRESLRQVAKSVGVSHSTLREHLSRSGFVGGLDY